MVVLKPFLSLNSLKLFSVEAKILSGEDDQLKRAPESKPNECNSFNSNTKSCNGKLIYGFAQLLKLCFICSAFHLFNTETFNFRAYSKSSNFAHSNPIVQSCHVPIRLLFRIIASSTEKCMPTHRSL